MAVRLSILNSRVNAAAMRPVRALSALVLLSSCASPGFSWPSVPAVRQKVSELTSSALNSLVGAAASAEPTAASPKQELIRRVISAETHYDVLGVAADATDRDIESAYGGLITSLVDPEPVFDFSNFDTVSILRKAKDVLTNKAARAEYDKSLAAARVKNTMDPNHCFARLDWRARLLAMPNFTSVAAYDGLGTVNCESEKDGPYNIYHEKYCLEALARGKDTGCDKCIWRLKNVAYLEPIWQATHGKGKCCTECYDQIDCTDESGDCPPAFLKCKVACLKKHNAVFDPARIRRKYNWAEEKSKYDGQDACAMLSKTCTSKPMQGMLLMSFLSVAAVQTWHFYGSRFGRRWWINPALCFTVFLAAIELARWFNNFPIADVHMAIIALAYYTLFCVGLTNIYLATPPAANEEE